MSLSCVYFTFLEWLKSHIDHVRVGTSRAFKTPQKHAAWRTIPSTYIFCELDNAIAPAMQESMIGGAGLDFKDVLRLKAGHSPFLSRADELAMIISNLVSKSG